MRRASVVALVTVLGLVVAGCAAQDGGTDGAAAHDHGERSPVAEGARVVEVTARSFAFDPAEIRVAAGEDVEIRLTAADIGHDFTVEEGNTHVFAGVGETASGGLRVDRPGTYAFVCTVPGHEAAGMRGTLIVEEA